MADFPFFKKKNDSIFQLSLTEIAFILIFILLLLLGWLYMDATQKLVKYKNENQQLSVQNEKLENDIERYGENYAVVSKALDIIESYSNADDLISKLNTVVKNQEQLEALRLKLEKQDETITILTEALRENGLDDTNNENIKSELKTLIALKKQLLSKLNDSSMTQQDIIQYLSQAVELRKNIEAVLGDNISEQERNEALQTFLQKIEENKVKENADLRGQVAYLQRRLNANGGRDLPPCWADEETGKPEFLLHIDITQAGLKIQPAWNDKRAEDVGIIPGLSDLVNKTLPREKFVQLAAPIRTYTDEKQCRHYVYIKNHVNSLKLFNNSRYAIEHVFYKVELQH